MCCLCFPVLLKVLEEQVVGLVHSVAMALVLAGEEEEEPPQQHRLPGAMEQLVAGEGALPEVLRLVVE